MLDIIQNNPYRLLGIYSNSPVRERVVNYNKLKAFLRVRKETAFGLDLTALLPVAARTGETVSDANTKLALPNDQLRYAQFWFMKSTPLDNVAMNHLATGNAGMALSIWKKRERCLILAEPDYLYADSRRLPSRPRLRREAVFRIHGRLRKPRLRQRQYGGRRSTGIPFLR